MKPFRISEKKTYDVTIFGKDERLRERFIGSFYDGGFRSVGGIISAAQNKVNNKTVTKVNIYCVDDDTYATYNGKGKRI